MDWRQKMEETAFGKATRQNIRNGNNITWVTGGRDTLILPRVGYLARVHIHFNGVATVTLGGGTAALDTLGPYNSLNRLKLTANSGQDIYSTSGYGSRLVNEVMISGHGYFLDDDMWFAAAPSYSGQVFQAATAGGANTWDWGVVLPVALNEESELGLILLQNEMAQNTVAYEMNSNVYSLVATVAPILVTGAATATLTGTFTHLVEYFAVPADPQNRPDITWIHQILEFTQAITNLGDNTVNLLRDNMYVDLLHHVVLNNVPNTTDVDRIRMVLNQSDTIYDFQKRDRLQLQRREYHRDLPLGVYTYPLFNQGNPGYGDERDLLNGRATSELQSIITINAGATLGTNPRVNTIQRQLVKLLVPPTRQA